MNTIAKVVIAILVYLAVQTVWALTARGAVDAWYTNCLQTPKGVANIACYVGIPFSFIVARYVWILLP